MDFNFNYSEEQLREVAEKIIKLAQQKGATASEVSVSESSGLEVAVRCGNLDSLEINQDQGISISVLYNGAKGVASVGDLHPAAYQEAVAKAVAIARASQPDPYEGLAEADLMATEFPDLSLFHPWQIDAEGAIALAKECEEASWAVAGVSLEKSEGAGVASTVAQNVYGNSNGFIGAKRSTVHSINCGAVAQGKDGEMEREGWSESERCAQDIPSPAFIGKKAGELAVARLGGQSVPDTRANVLFDRHTACSLIQHFVGAASGAALYRKTSWLLGRLGENIFPPHFSLQDSPHLLKRFGSRVFDADGVATQNRTVVNNGAWEGYFLSAYSARRMGLTTTGNASGSHNLVVSAKTAPSAEMLKMVGEGLLVTELMGQGVNNLTGDYSRGAGGFWVKDGAIQYPVSGITIAGNLSDIFKSLVCMGDDAQWHHKIYCGSLLVPDLTIGGNT